MTTTLFLFKMLKAQSECRRGSFVGSYNEQFIEDTMEQTPQIGLPFLGLCVLLSVVPRVCVELTPRDNVNWKAV